ncbi:MAG: hypothetical protein ACLFPV_06695 [Spirochaetaceae bacterium]
MAEKRIAILGSSGGNLYNIGGRDPSALIGEFNRQLQAAGMEIGVVQFVGARASMDQAKESTKAELYVWENGRLIGRGESTLAEVNRQATGEDARIAQAIQSGDIDGLILVSAEPRVVNKRAIEAAAEKKIPVAGTGGTSMAQAQSMGANVVATSGSTGTTNRTRAISAVTALARVWKLSYKPVIGSAETQLNNDSIWSRISLRGIMISALPGFIAMALVLAMSKIPGLGGLSAVFDILIQALPVIVAAIAAKQVSGLDEVGIVAGIAAGLLSTNGGVIGGLLGGILAGVLVYYLVRLTIQWNFPATTVNIVAGGIAGLISGFIIYFLVAPAALWLGDGIRQLIESALDYNAMLAGAIAGLLIWPAIIFGVYHAAILPIVLLEMERAGNSFLGAVDMTGLVMVSAGITLANILFPKEKREATIAAPGFLINMGFGTFVEAAYPFMFSDKFVMAGAIFSAGLSGLFVGLLDVRGTAYVPSVVAPTLSNNPWGFVLAMAIALVSAFIITTLANRLPKRRAVKGV